MEGSISEGELRAGIANGGRILDVVVVRWRRNRKHEFRPHLRLSWLGEGARYYAISLWRNTGLRTYNDIRPFLARLDGPTLGRYGGRVELVLDTDPLVSELGLDQPA